MAWINHPGIDIYAVDCRTVSDVQKGLSELVLEYISAKKNQDAGKIDEENKYYCIQLNDKAIDLVKVFYKERLALLKKGIDIEPSALEYSIQADSYNGLNIYPGSKAGYESEIKYLLKETIPSSNKEEIISKINIEDYIEGERILYTFMEQDFQRFKTALLEIKEKNKKIPYRYMNETDLVNKRDLKYKRRYVKRTLNSKTIKMYMKKNVKKM